jgi:hypothetical protein
METTRIRIDLAQGIVEAEGSEEFVRSIYDDFRSSLEDQTTEKASRANSQTKKKGATKKKGSGGRTKTKRSGAGRGSPSIVKDLDLSGGGKKQKLRDFYNKFKPSSNFEKNLIFVYYLTQELGMTGVTVDHVFTCYRDIPGIKAPTALQQSLWDTTNRRGWLDTASSEDIKVTVPGINYLEHDMPIAATE